jgi:hypothetical protein
MSNALERFNQTIDTWIEQLNNYSYDTLIKKPIPGSWSMGQVYVHIIEDTPWHVEQMKAALATNADGEKEMHDNARWMFQNDMFPDIQIEGASTDESVAQPVSKEELLQQLAAIRTEVNELYRSHDFVSSKGKTRHPGLLFFSALEWLQFTEMHMRHHFRQKKRIDDKLTGI